MQPGKEFADGLEHLGWTSNAMFNLGFVELACVLVYLIPRTSVIGAVLLTAYLGGAVATHVRIGDPFWAPILVGVLIWGGLWMRDGFLLSFLRFNQQRWRQIAVDIGTTAG